jgi:hypothetical protein
MDKADEEYFDLLERRSQRRPAPPCWYQLVITSRRVSIVPPTHIGIEPFNDDPEGKKRCILGDPRDHVIGLNILSELSIRESSWDGADVACTESLLGQIITYEDAKRMDDQSRKFMNPIYRENFRGRVAGQSKETWIPGGIRRRLLVISPRLYRLLTEHKLTGFSTEVAHLR